MKEKNTISDINLHIFLFVLLKKKNNKKIRKIVKLKPISANLFDELLYLFFFAFF
jgi:hypothetical protein